MKKSTIAFFVTILTALIWGVGYTASEYAMWAGWSTYAIILQRSIISFLCFFALAFKSKFWKNKSAWCFGIISGLLFFGGYALQLGGQQLTTVSNTAFLSSLGIILVPLFSFLIFRKKPSLSALIGCFIGVIGICFLSLDVGGKVNIGDAIVLGGSICYALHILWVERIGDKVNIFALGCIQSLVMGILSFIVIVITKGDFRGEWWGFNGVFYYAFFSGFLAFIGQAWALRHLEASKVSLALTLESVFATLFAVLLNMDTITNRILIGGPIILVGLVIMQLDIKIKTKKIVKND